MHSKSFGGAGLLAALLVAAAVVVVAAGVLFLRGGDVDPAQKHHCPMHPTYVSDGPGECPICGMYLVPVVEEPEAAQDAGYHCPMHPTYISDTAGECPICGMSLVPIEGVETLDHAGMHTGPEGMAPIKISPERQHMIGVTKEPVERRDLSMDIRAVGIVEADETKTAVVHTKVEGWIEKLHVDYTGKLVKKGQPLMSIYSPQLVATQEEYLLALKAAEKYRESPFPEVAEGGEGLLRSTRKRLELWDIDEGDIERLERTREVSKTLTLYSPLTGHVTSKNAVEGAFVTPGIELFVITDLSAIWVMGDVYESDLSYVHPGQKASLTLSYYPGDVLEGVVSYVYPYLEEATRTAKVRFDFANPDLRLKPGMYVNVELSSELGKQIAVPKGAVLDTGERQITFVVSGEGTLTPRQVKLGARAGEYWVVLEGLQEGEIVVTSANFLIDSESRLRAAISGSGGGGHEH